MNERSERNERRQNRRILRDEYYDDVTKEIIKSRLSDDEKNEIYRNPEIREHQYLRKKWKEVVLALSDSLLDEYYGLRLQTQRNCWIKKWLDETNRSVVTLLPL